MCEQNEIYFNTDNRYWLDVEEFENCVRPKRTPSPMSDACQNSPDTIQTLIRSIELYRGDLMEGCYQDWCLVERERLHMLFLDALIHLMNHHREQGALNEAIHCAQAILKHDPLLEQLHRELIEMHYRAGNRAAPYGNTNNAAQSSTRNWVSNP